MFRAAVALLFASVLAAQAPPALDSAPAVQTQAAPDSALEARTTAVSRELRCPVCQGLSIQDSPSELSQEMKGIVRDQLRAGKTPDEVKAYFVSKYGEWILLEPKARGFNLLIYALPFAVLLGGAAVIFVVVRKWTHAPPSNTPTPDLPND